MKKLIGIDIGGSHITLAQIDALAHKIIPETYVREHVDSSETKENILETWVSAIKKVAGDSTKELLLGIAMPGPFDYQNGICLLKHGKFIHLYLVNLKVELAKKLEISSSQIFFINDAAAFLEGEVFGGCVQNYKSIFGITLCTGLGTTFYDGTEATDEDLWDAPFGDSFAEDYLATRWFVNHFEELTGQHISGSKDLLDEDPVLQKKVFDLYADTFSEFIIRYVVPYYPQILVIGGNIAKAYPLFKDRFLSNLEKENISLRVEISVIFEDAAILGAASHALKNGTLKNN